MGLLFLLISKYGAAQNVKFVAERDQDNETVAHLFKDFSKQIPPRDSVTLIRMLRTQLGLLYEAGNLAASIDSIEKRDSIFLVYWYIGDHYDIAELHTTPEEESLLTSAGIRDKLYRKTTFTPSRYAKLMGKILTWCSNNGYPFALVKLDSVKIENAKITATLIVDKGPLILLDTVQVRGDAKLSKAYLVNYLSIKAGTPYNDQVMRRMSSRVKELPFVSEARSPEVDFFPGLARPVLFLQPKKASQFNGIIGVQPDNQNSGKTHITGDVKLRLLNAFGKAELLDLNWSNPLPQTQDLRIKMSYPFLFNTPFGVDLDLSLYKKDTSYFDFNRLLGIRYYLKGSNSLRVFGGRTSSNLISVNQVQTGSELPPYADVTTNTFGLGVQLEHLDYRLNPRKGYALEASAGAGIRTIEQTSTINPEIYDSLAFTSTQYKAVFNGDIYLPLALRGVLDLGVMSGYIQSPSIFQNELYRIGGLKSLRGFDEGSILASSFLMGKVELRFILEQNSYLLVFFNQAYVENKSQTPFFHDTPYGFGAGITFETKIGIFSFTYAMGSQQDSPLLVRDAIVHFGIVNYF